MGLKLEHLVQQLDAIDAHIEVGSRAILRLVEVAVGHSLGVGGEGIVGVHVSHVGGQGSAVHGDESYTNTMMVELGERLYFAKGSDKNIKLTTPDDLEIFKGYLAAKKEK